MGWANSQGKESKASAQLECSAVIIVVITFYRKLAVCCASYGSTGTARALVEAFEQTRLPVALLQGKRLRLGGRGLESIPYRLRERS